MPRFIITESEKKDIFNLYGLSEQTEKSIAKDIYDASSGVGTDEEKFLKAVLSIDTLETFKKVDRILKTFDYGGGFYDYVEGELGMFDEELINKIKNHVKNLKSKAQDVTQGFTDGTKMKASQQFWDHVKEYEGDAKKRVNGVKEPKYKAYKDSVGVWTIGYGHTSVIGKPNVTQGLTINKKQALDILYADAKIAANCIRRMFKRWDNEDVKYTVTQSQFDVLVSLVFNAGCKAVLNSDFIIDFKNGNIKEAAEKIKTFRLNAGKARRNKESEIFLS